MTPDVATKRDSEEASVLVWHLHQFGKQSNAVGLERRTQIVLRVLFIKTPELLGVVPSKEVGEATEKVFKRFQVRILDMSMSSWCRLASKPKPVLLQILIRVELAREREVHTDERSYVFRNQVDDFLWVGCIPHVNVNHPQRVLCVDRASFLCSKACRQQDCNDANKQIFHGSLIFFVAKLRIFVLPARPHLSHILFSTSHSYKKLYCILLCRKPWTQGRVCQSMFLCQRKPMPSLGGP